MQKIKTTKKTDILYLITTILLLFLTSCGQIGPLYLPGTSPPHLSKQAKTP